MYVNYGAAVIFGICLVAVLFALIFNKSFRQDLSAQPGKFQFFGASVEGVIVVLITGLLVVALLVSTNWAVATDVAYISETNSILLVNLPFNPSITSPAMAKEKIRKLYEDSQKPTDILLAVKTLNPTDSISEELRKLPIILSGPWAIDTKAKMTSLSVPSAMGKGHVNACPTYVNSKIEIRSNSPINRATAKSVEVYVENYISQDETCESDFPFIQVSCDLANQIFSDEVVTCDRFNRPLWKKPTKDNLQPVFVTRLSTHS
ncbi:hypothetical protein ELE36_07045 [Pseudolysobacter antarcticus]|uniref:Uncharacterized protein n=1 Tax=Pseudolysobacter antarcticus TaxID=2511995 RepID=A0A411HIB8_9GAMM|nr:hypothetical protein [Pseudolysobacter antarcticus]QBB70140.1 hypothetical protein ELE36_07045 [Pseudolysobacter antarcticus]